MSTESPSEIEQEVAQLVAEIGQNLTDNYLAVPTICILVHEILFNFDKEVEYIWKARWSVTKVLFIFGRYYGLCFNIASFAVSTTIGLSAELYVICKGWFLYDIVAGDIFFTTVVNVILIMRLYAMYRNRTALVILVTLLICEFAFELYGTTTLVVETYRSVFTIPEGIPLAGCFASGANVKIALFAWVPCMVVATSFFVMTVAKVRSDGITIQHPLRPGGLKYISPLIMSMVRDGALYYCLMITILLVTVIPLETGGGLVGDIPNQWLVAIYSLAASRLVLNLRETAHRSHFGGTSQFGGSKITGPPEFAMHPIGRTVRSMETSSESFDQMA